MQASFTIIKNLQYDIILGTRFLIHIQPFLVNHFGIQTHINGKSILFEFLQKSKIGIIEDTYV